MVVRLFLYIVLAACLIFYIYLYVLNGLENEVMTIIHNVIFTLNDVPCFSLISTVMSSLGSSNDILLVRGKVQTTT